MYIEIIVVAVLIFVVLTVNGFINPNKFVQDNSSLFSKLKEYDYNVNGAYFVTVCTENRKSMMCDIIVGDGFHPFPKIKITKMYL